MSFDLQQQILPLAGSGKPAMGGAPGGPLPVIPAEVPDAPC